jgi:hypothetical protein
MVQNLRLLPPLRDTSPVIKLLLDRNTVIYVGDKPVFGADVTMSESLKSFGGKIILPGVILGWVNYVEISRFACFTLDNHYVEANNYIRSIHNQIILSKAIKVHDVDSNMAKSKYILSFSELR